MADRRDAREGIPPLRMYGSARMSGGHSPRRGRPPIGLIWTLAAMLVLAAVAVVLLVGRPKPAADDPVAPAVAELPAIGLAARVSAPPSAEPKGTAEPRFSEDFGEGMPIDEGEAGGESLTDDSYREDEVVGARPTAAPGGYLPIFSKAKTGEKIIAITVDDCNQTENLDGIVDCAVQNGGKLTIFPIGKNLAREGLQEVIREAHSLGMELENHSYSHSKFYTLTAEEMAKEIYNQNRAVSYVLGVNYRMHFMRTRCGDNRRDLRTHQYIQKLGYYGMAHWSMNGSNTAVEKLKSTIAPGNIYLFHTTDSDLAKLLELIPYARAQGYKMVTLNEMFGYPANEEIPITTPVKELPVPEPDPYVYEYKLLKRGDYLWDVYLLQQRLIELGWLKGTPDGDYGKSTYMAIGYFQLAAGIKADGKASPETQEALFSETAFRSLDGKKPVGGTATVDPNAPIATTAPRVTQKPVDIDMTVFD